MAFNPASVPASQVIILTLDSSGISSDQTDFPLTIVMDSSLESVYSRIFTTLGSNSKRLSIDISGTQLPIEIEFWDNSSERAVLHTKIPTYASASDMEILLSYDNSQADNTDYVDDIGSTVAQSVWSNAVHEAVYHHNQNNPVDATGNYGGAVSACTVINTVYGKAIETDGTEDELVSVVHSSAPQLIGTIAVIALLKADSTNYQEVAKWDYNNLAGWGLRITNSNIVSIGFKKDSTNKYGMFTDSAIADGFCVVGFNYYVDGTAPVIYHAGTAPAQTSQYVDGDALHGITDSGDPLYLGGLKTLWGSGGLSQVSTTGEVRIYNDTLSADWHKLTALSITDQLITATSEYIFPSVGSSTSTGYAPLAILNLFPLVGSSTSTGYAPLAEVAEPLTISSLLPNLDGSGELADVFDLSGFIPDLKGSLEWGIELSVDTELPELDGSMDFGLQVDSDLPDMQGTIDVVVPFEISSSLPYLTGSMDLGVLAEISLPGLQASMGMEIEANFDFSVSLPGVTGSVELAINFDLAGTLPELTGSMELDIYDYFNISGDYPQLGGSITWEDANDFTLVCKLPAITGSAEIEINQTLVIDADLPPLALSLLDFSDVSSSDLSASFTPATDDIIRHRRGYDNG